MSVRYGTQVVVLATDIFSSHGGIQRLQRSVLKALGEAQRTHGFRAHVISMNDSAESARKVRDLGLHATFVGTGRSLSLFILSALRVLPKSDLVLTNHLNLAGLAYVRGIRRPAFWVMAYGSELSRAKSAFSRSCLRRSDLLIAISDFTRRQLLRLGIDGAKVAVCHLSVDAELFRPANGAAEIRSRLGLGAAKVVLSVGRMEPADYHKGYDVLIQAMPAVLERCGNVTLLLAGGGDDVPRLKRLARVIGVETAVRFLGSVSDAELVQCYQACDVFALISQKEGFGLVFLEALACGKPVIAGNRDASREVLLDGELGLLVNPDSPAEAAQAIVRVLEGRVPAEWRDPLYLRRRALAKFGFDAFARRLERLMVERGALIENEPITPAASQ